MPTATEQCFLDCLRCAFSGAPLPAVPDGAALFDLANKHDLAHLIADAVPSDTDGRFRTVRYAAVMRYEQLQYELDAVRACLSEAEIAFMPLKGAVLHAQYPEPWWRTSCDIDVLVHREQLEQAATALESALGYRRGEAGNHDVTLVAPSGVHLELHFDIGAEGGAPAVCEVLAGVWEQSTADGCEYRMNDAMFYFYHIAHMAKHIGNGGCGVRPFLDLKVLRGVPHDERARRRLLERGSLVRFADVAEQLSAYWLDGTPAEPAALWLEAFILGGGSYGTGETLAAVQQSRRGGRARFLWERLFPPYRYLKYEYPSLARHRWLYPVCAVRRWGRKAFGNERRTVAARMKSATAVTASTRHAVSKLLEALDLPQ